MTTPRRIVPIEDEGSIRARTSLRSGITFNEVMERIEMHEGETFHTAQGVEFKYRVIASGIALIPSKFSLSWGLMQKGFELCPLPNPMSVRHLMNPSAIYAILSDPRIRQTDW